MLLEVERALVGRFCLQGLESGMRALGFRCVLFVKGYELIMIYGWRRTLTCVLAGRQDRKT